MALKFSPKWIAPGVLFAIGALLVALQSGLPAETFVGGDSGLKLPIATHNALRQPTRPLDIGLPTIGARPVAFVERLTTTCTATTCSPHSRDLPSTHGSVPPQAGQPRRLRAAGNRAAGCLGGLGMGGPLSRWAPQCCTHDPDCCRGCSLVVLRAGVLGAHAGSRAVRSRDRSISAGGVRVGSHALGAGAHIRHGVGRVGLVQAGDSLPRRRPADCQPVGRRRESRLIPGADHVWHRHGRRAVGDLRPSAFWPVRNPHLGINLGLATHDWLSLRGTLASTWFGLPSQSNAWCVAPLLALGCVPLSQRHRRDGRAFLAVTALVTTVLAISPRQTRAACSGAHVIC